MVQLWKEFYDVCLQWFFDWGDKNDPSNEAGVHDREYMDALERRNIAAITVSPHLAIIAARDLPVINLVNHVHCGLLDDVPND